MVDRSIGSRDELHESETSQTRVLCFDNRPLQKRERTGKEYGCFPFV